MKSIAEIHDQISDALNPIVVKELRQAVRSNFLVATLVLFLGIQLLIVGLSLTNESLSSSFNAGRSIFSALLSVLLVTCLLFVPAYTGIRLAIERSVENADLLFVTTLRPWSIIWGKFLAALVLTVLFYSAGMPFIAFTYLLRGIDLPSIFSLMAINFVVAAAAIQCAIFIGALPVKWVFKLIFGMSWFGFLFVVIPPLFAQPIMPGGLLDIGFATHMGTLRFWSISLGLTIVGLIFIGLLALWAAASISPLSANRALPVRAFSTVAWLLTGIGAAIWSYSSNSIVPIGGWAFPHIALYSIGLFVAVSERESIGRRIRRSIPRTWLLRPFAFPFYSGAGSGVAWSCLMMILTLTFFVTWSNLFLFPHLMFPGDFYQFFFNLSIQIGFFLSHTLGSHLLRHRMHIFDVSQLTAALPILGMYAFSYALGASLIRRCFLADRVSAGHTWIIGLVLFGFSTTIIPVILFFHLGTWNANCFIASPIGPFLYLDVHHELMGNSAAIAIGSATLVGVLSIPWFVRQYRNFQPVWQRRATKP